MKATVVGVAVENTGYHFDKLYTYFVPVGMTPPAIGCRVTVPFGGGNAHRTGYVLECAQTQVEDGVKPILQVLDQTPLLTDEMIRLAVWMKEHTFCCYHDAFKTMLPAGIQMQMAVSYTPVDGNREQLPLALQSVWTDLCDRSQPIPREKWNTNWGLSDKDLKAMVKAGLLTLRQDAVRRLGDATIQTVYLTPQGEQEETVDAMTPKQRSVAQLLLNVGAASLKEVCYYTGVGVGVVKTMAKKGYVELREEETFRIPDYGESGGHTGEITLQGEQVTAYQTLEALLLSEKPAASLLYGVTGSGKTSVYLKLIDKALAEYPGKGIIVMVPEIALTPQAMAIFKSRYGSQVAIFHSRLSLGERLDEWKRVKNGLAHIVVGTRSAVFAPFEQISMIVMDEEQEHTYKSESSPRFHARDVARFRAAYHNGLLVLASATPSVESFAKAKAGVYTLCTMHQRYGEAKLPTVETVDLRDELNRGNCSAFSSRLVDLLEDNLTNGKQSILLLNRRGYHTFISCSSCGNVMECPECSISMTYHRDNNRMMCHYCGHSLPLPERCPVCGGEMMKMTGLGTQKAEEQLQNLLPGARILRMDADSTMSRTAHSDKLDAFAKGEYDILIGTQMVAKGLDFPSVTLVGVLNADQMLHNNDYRAYERGFSLLTQVIGRAGRADANGMAVIQTAQPDHELVALATGQDYESFFEQEIQLRKMMEYPPYCDICVIGFVGVRRDAVERASFEMLRLLKEYVGREYASLPLKILGPAPAQVVKVGGKYRYRMMIKCRNQKPFREMLGKALTEMGTIKGFGGVSVFADMNPEGIL